MADPNRDPGNPYGYDVDVELDIAPDGRACSGSRLVTNAWLHRLLEDTLPLTGAPGGVVPYGRNVRNWIGEVTTPSAAAAKGPEIVAILNRDTRVDPSQTRVQLSVVPVDGAHVNLQLAVSGALTNGTPIGAVYSITKATVALLAQGT